MLTYFAIGIIVEILIVNIRVCVRKVTSFKYFKTRDYVAFSILFIINVLIWPITILAEIINTIKGY